MGKNMFFLAFFWVQPKKCRISTYLVVGIFCFPRHPAHPGPGSTQGTAFTNSGYTSSLRFTLVSSTIYPIFHHEKHMEPRKKKRGPLLSIESWLVNDGILKFHGFMRKSLYHWVGNFIPYNPTNFFFIAHIIAFHSIGGFIRSRRVGCFINFIAPILLRRSHSEGWSVHGSMPSDEQ